MRKEFEKEKPYAVELYVKIKSKFLKGKMDKQNSFNKALRLLDKGETERAIELLKELNENSFKEEDIMYAIKTSCILGEYYLLENQTEAGLGYLEKVIKLKEADDDICDILEYEISRAEELLDSIQ